MKKKTWTNEFKVGLFVVLCCLGLFWMTYSTGKLDIKDKGYYIDVIFSEAAGMNVKAPVMLNGLEIGKVDEITPSYDHDKTRIIFKLWLSDKVKIRKGSKISIKMMGMMGEKYVQIESSQEKEFVAPDSTLQGEPYVDLDVLIQNLNNTVEDNKNEIKSAIKNFNSLLVNLDGTVSDNRNSLTQTIKNFEGTSQNFLEFSDDLKRNPWKLLFKTSEKTKGFKKKNDSKAK